MQEATREPAESGIVDEVKRSIAEKVRDESKNQVKLTALASLTPPDSSLNVEEATTKIAEMAGEVEYQDIKTITMSSGDVYLYSASHISDSYAAILVKVEADDPRATIVGTVRDEGRVYERPIKYEALANPVFNIKQEEMKQHLAAVMEREEFKDIKSIEASTGALYLYSDLYVNEACARAHVEWEEVEQYDNP